MPAPWTIFIDANIFLHHAFYVNPALVEFLKKVESSDLKAYISAMVMERKGITNIASNDSDFKAISSTILWSPD